MTTKTYSDNPKAVAQRALRERRRQGILQHSNRSNVMWRRTLPWDKIAHLYFIDLLKRRDTTVFQACGLLNFALDQGYVILLRENHVTHMSPSGVERTLRARVLHATYGAITFWEREGRIQRAPVTGFFLIPQSYLKETKHAETETV